MTIRWLPLLLIGLLVFSEAMAARQETRPAFDVTSVKPSVPPEPNRFGFPIAPSMQFVQGGFGATQATLRDLVRRAYDLPDFRIIGGAAWMVADRFDVTAKAEPGFAGGNDALRAMLRSLLADRFALRVHTERRELPLFQLVSARPDGRPGPRLRPSSTGGPPPRPTFTLSGAAMTIAFERQTLDDLAALLSAPETRRHVVNRTGIAGTFDGEVTFAPERLPGFPPPPPAAGAVSLFTALQEQLGLRLEPGRGPVDVLVIDGASRPGAN